MDDFVTEKMCSLRHEQANEKFDSLIAAVKEIGASLEGFRTAGAEHKAWATIGKLAVGAVTVLGTVYGIAQMVLK
jgi:hypothetical protein